MTETSHFETDYGAPRLLTIAGSPGQWPTYTGNLVAETRGGPVEYVSAPARAPQQRSPHTVTWSASTAEVIRLVSTGASVEYATFNVTASYRPRFVIDWKPEFSVQQPLDPFAISLSEFHSIPHEHVQRLLAQVRRACSKRLDAAWADGMKSVVVCRGEIVWESRNLEVTEESVRVIERELGTPCYVFSSPDVVEESSTWSPSVKGEPYPTIPIYLGVDTEPTAQILNEGRRTDADFDTGNLETAAFSPWVGEGVFNITIDDRVRDGVFIKTEYFYYQKTARIISKDTDGDVHECRRQVRLVRDWERSPFLQQSRRRIGYVGRDLLGAFGVPLLLDPVNHSSTLIGTKHQLRAASNPNCWDG